MFMVPVVGAMEEAISVERERLAPRRSEKKRLRRPVLLQMVKIGVALFILFS
jgi:hypothetical protein